MLLPDCYSWYLPPWGITIWAIDDGMLLSNYFVDDVLLGNSHSNLTQESGGCEVALTMTDVLALF